MIWSDPNSRISKVSAALTSTIDIAPSILERADIDPYFGMQGSSLLNCVDGSNNHRENLLIEFNDGFARDGFDVPARVRSVINPNWQLSVYKNQSWGELYDLKHDPQQTHNLWDSSQHQSIRAELHEILVQELIGQMDESPQSSRLA